MRNVIARDFSFSRDFRSICWGPTIRYNLIRTAATGCILAVVMFVAVCIAAVKQDDAPAATAFLFPMLYPIMWPLAFVICLLPAGLILIGLAKMGVPFMAPCYMILAFISVSLGDPLLCVINRVKPGVVPVDEPPLMSLNLIYYVLKPEETEEFAIANQMKRPL